MGYDNDEGREYGAFHHSWPGLNRDQVARLETRARAERVIRGSMRGSGSTAAEIETYLSDNLPEAREVMSGVLARAKYRT